MIGFYPSRSVSSSFSTWRSSTINKFLVYTFLLNELETDRQDGKHVNTTPKRVVHERRVRKSNITRVVRARAVLVTRCRPTGNQQTAFVVATQQWFYIVDTLHLYSRRQWNFFFSYYPVERMVEKSNGAHPLLSFGKPLGMWIHEWETSKDRFSVFFLTIDIESFELFNFLFFWWISVKMRIFLFC